MYISSSSSTETNKQTSKTPTNIKTRKTSDLLKFQAYQDHTIILRDLAFSFNKKELKKKFPLELEILAGTDRGVMMA